MGDNNNCYGSANKMLRKAMKEYGISGSAAQDAFGWDISALTGLVSTAGGKIAEWAANNPDQVTQIASAGVSLATGAKKTEKRGKRTIQKAGVAQRRSTSTNDAMVANITRYIGEYTTMAGEMRRQLTSQGVLDSNAQNEIIRNAFVAELYDSPPADTYQRNTLKALVSRMDANLQTAYAAKAHG